MSNNCARLYRYKRDDIRFSGYSPAQPIKRSAAGGASSYESIPSNKTNPPGFINRHIFHRNPSKPVGAVVVYRQDTKVYRGITHRESRTKGGGIRGRVTGFSRQSRDRMIFAFRNMPKPKIMLTLTYPGAFPVDGKKVKRDLDSFRKWLARRGVLSAWFLEFQERGAPHFHIFISLPVKKEKLSLAWYRIVGSGDEKHLRAGTKVEWLRNPNAAGIYASKYGAKAEQKEVPEEYKNVGRFWGMSRKLKPEPVLYIAEVGKAIYPVIRAIRRLYNARRRQWGKKKYRDKGYYSMKLWGCGADVLVSG